MINPIPILVMHILFCAALFFIPVMTERFKQGGPAIPIFMLFVSVYWVMGQYLISIIIERYDKWSSKKPRK